MRSLDVGDAEVEPEEIGDQLRDIYGLYEATDTWRWSLFCPQRGDVVVTMIPPPIAPEEGVYGAFGMLTRTLMSDGSLVLGVKSLGSGHAEVTTALSRAFNRRPGCLHVCHPVGDCPVQDDPDIVFHCRSLELADGATFSAPYLGEQLGEGC